jgi:glycosyltransferase involved in cell wall biosynthesis
VSTVKKIIFINSHPIQYFAPLYQYLNTHGLEVSCWYCSDENVKGHLDRQFGKQVQWDVPLLEGYSYRFFKNRSWKPSLYNGFFGLFNPGMIAALFREPKSVVIVHGWGYLTNILTIIFGRLAGHTICLRGESPLNQELLKSKANRWLKRILFGGLIFPLIHKFLFIGTQNKSFYTYYGVKEDRLLFVPYAVDNDRFQKAARLLVPQRNMLRSRTGYPVNSNIILFTGKFTEKKRPMDLLNAYERLSQPGKCLVMVGDGELRQQMQDFIEERRLQAVFLPGFINQSEIVNYYAMADIFVMCSGEGETWGLSVNEAMNFNLPVVVSNMAGCSSDLVQNDTDGHVFKTGDINDLLLGIRKTLNSKKVASKVLDGYSFDTIMIGLLSIARN